MKNFQLGKIILFGSIVMGCLMAIQIYWFTQAFDVAEKQFDHSVQIALKKVADTVSDESEIKKMSSSFFFVSTTNVLDNSKLEGLLKNEFRVRNVNVDYELGIYNAQDDTLIYGKYIDASGKRWHESRFSGLPDNSVNKNFAVHFPSKKTFLAGQLGIWIFSTVILLLMMVFFAFAMASLLRERKFAELKNDFINNMTHEFKTPVTNIGIAAEILKNKINSEDSKNIYVDILLRENEKLREKIDKVLLGASGEYVNKEVFTKTDLHLVISECAAAFRFKVEERNGNIRLDFNVRSSIILGDRELLVQAISNVIDNAEKYSRQTPEITVRTIEHEKAIEISILDRGIGIPDTLKTKVFEKFFRVQTGNVHNVKGFGLGLNFVKNVVRSHRGYINLKSELNKGTEIKIYLPKA